MAPNEKTLQLPVSIIGPTDIARLVREINSIDDFFRQANIRSGGNDQTTDMPHPSKLMDQLVSDNQLNLLQEADRTFIASTIESLRQKAPVMHVSFSVDPPGSHVQKIVGWLRQNIDESVLVTVGLQPNIGAGCVVRTTNKIFDFSLREFFASKREFFVEKMHAATTQQQAQEQISQPVNPEVQP